MSLRTGPEDRDDRITDLVTCVDPLLSDALTLHAYEAFSSCPVLYALPIVDPAGRPVGLINRFRFLEQLSRPFGRDLLEHRSVATVMEGNPLIVDEGMSLDQLSGILADDGTRYIFDGFIVTRQGRYVGIGTGYSLMRRLTERRQNALFHLAHHDALTGLPNRQLFSDRLQQALARAERSGRLLAVLCLDVDRFKGINDGLGHVAGDAVLKGIADRLRAVTRAQDTVARLGGDEFAIILTDIGIPEDADLVAAKMLDVLRAPHLLEGHEVNVSCSIGIAVYPFDGCSDAAIVRAADDASYHAKQFRSAARRYSTDMQRTQPQSLLAASSVRRAIELSHLEVHYQPQIHARTRALYGFEAFVRWRQPVQGVKSAADLIETAEDAGLIAAVTDFVLGESMREIGAWGRHRGGAVRLAVNVSGVQIRDGALIPMIERHLRETGFPAADLELEITEATAMRSDASTTAVLRELKRLGIGVVIDDFGTGYSSLSRLHRLPIDGLKIDQSLVQGIEDDADGGALAEAIIAMAHSMRLPVTAEGVETLPQLEFFEERGCERLQGHVISRPLPPSDLAGFRADAPVRGNSPDVECVY